MRSQWEVVLLLPHPLARPTLSLSSRRFFKKERGIAMERLYKVLPLVFLMMFWFFGFAETGNAYCVHHNSPITLSVSDEFCCRCYSGTLHSGASGFCPGADAGCRGTTMIYVEYAFPWNCLECLYCPCEGTAHGDVYITGTDLGQPFITRLPATYAECGPAISEAIRRDQWEELGQLSQQDPQPIGRRPGIASRRLRSPSMICLIASSAVRSSAPR